MNIVNRSSEAGKSIMPPTANNASGNTSVRVIPASVASRSAALPGTAAACGANASVLVRVDPVTAAASETTAAAEATAASTVVRAPSTPRSAMSATARIDTTNIAPCRYRAGPSITTAPAAVVVSVPASRTTATSAASKPAKANTRWLA